MLRWLPEHELERATKVKADGRHCILPRMRTAYEGQHGPQFTGRRFWGHGGKNGLCVHAHRIMFHGRIQLSWSLAVGWDGQFTLLLVRWSDKARLKDVHPSFYKPFYDNFIVGNYSLLLLPRYEQKGGFLLDTVVFTGIAIFSQVSDI